MLSYKEERNVVYFSEELLAPLGNSCENPGERSQMPEGVDSEVLERTPDGDGDSHL